MNYSPTFSKLLFSITVTIFTSQVQADFPDTRGSILTVEGTPTKLNPAGGYIGVTKDYPSGKGQMGIQEYYDLELASGIDVQTSIKGLLQSYTTIKLIRVKSQLQAKEVFAMVMDSKTGELITIASSNGYNPLHIKQDDIPSLIPKFSSYPYEPGAVMMPFTVAMLLNSHLGERNKYKEWFNTDYDKYPIGENRWITDDAKKKAQTMSDMLLHSSNIGITQVAEQVLPEVFSYALDNYGFGHKSGIDLPRDLEGIVKESALFESKMHRANTGYGYGIMATPMQLLKAYSMFANDGWMVTPHIASSVDVERKEVLAKPIANKLKNMLVRVVKEGTGKKAQVEGLIIGGKTGAAHIAEEGKYVQKYHSSFYGFVEDNQGHNYTIGVLVIEAKAPKAYFASRSAVPVFKSIVEAMVEQKLLSPTSNEIDPSIVLAPKDENDSLGYYDLAKDYHEGKKIEPDYVKAMTHYKRSCELKYGLACLSVAYMYVNGEGVPQSREKASEYFAKACDYGYAGGCKNWNSMNGYAPEVPNISQP